MVKTQLYALQKEILPELKKNGIQLLQWDELSASKTEEVQPSICCLLSFIVMALMPSPISASIVFQGFLRAHIDASGNRSWPSLSFYWKHDHQHCSGGSISLRCPACLLEHVYFILSCIFQFLTQIFMASSRSSKILWTMELILL